MSDKIVEILLLLAAAGIIILGLTMAGQLGFVIGGILDALDVIY